MLPYSTSYRSPKAALALSERSLLIATLLSRLARAYWFQVLLQILHPTERMDPGYTHAFRGTREGGRREGSLAPPHPPPASFPPPTRDSSTLLLTSGLEIQHADTRQAHSAGSPSSAMLAEGSPRARGVKARTEFVPSISAFGRSV